MRNPILYTLLFTVMSMHFLQAQNNPWLTYYEQSGYKETPRYKETIEYCQKLSRHSDWITYTTFGKSARNRDLPLIIANKDGKFDLQQVRESGDLILMVEACIHPGESEGKDAGLMLLRDIAIHKKHTELLDGITLLFIPILNADGHERFGPYNRINQNGPKEMGWRTNAQNLNLNRDFLKADAPEMQAWIRLFNQWLPDFFVDIHTTDGADYQYVITYAMETFGNMSPKLTQWQKESFLNRITPRMEKAGMPIFPYVSFREWHNPESGMVALSADPKLSQGYTAIQNRPGLLLETHMLKDYQTRVSGTYEMLKHTMDILKQEKEKLQSLIHKADQYTRSSAFRTRPYALDYQATGDSTMVDFRGIEYTKKQSDLTGATWFQYGDKPVTFQIPYFNKLKPTEEVNLPEYYIIPPEWNQVIERIKLHGIQTYRIKDPLNLQATVTMFTNVNWRHAPYEGRHQVTNFDTRTHTEKVNVPVGSCIVPLNQRRAKVIAHMLEPDGPDSFVKWGFFNAIFEQKEYAEMYLMEEMAREMLQNDSTLRQEFLQKKQEDPQFDQNPWAITNWFYKRTPYWDEHKNRYPVLKVFDSQSVNILHNLVP